MTERDKAYLQIANQLQRLLKERWEEEGPPSIVDYANHYVGKLKNAHATIKPFKNPYAEWYYGQDTDYAWCKSLPETFEVIGNMVWVPKIKGFRQLEDVELSHVDDEE